MIDLGHAKGCSFAPGLNGHTQQVLLAIAEKQQHLRCRFRMLALSHGTATEDIMNPRRIPGNEPDRDEMSTEPGTGAPNDDADTRDLPDDAENLGDFA